MKHFRFSLANNWYVILIGALGLSAAAAVLLFRLGSLTGGLSSGEYALWQRTFIEGFSLVDIMRDAAYLPYQLLLGLVQYLPFHGNGAIRISGILFGLIGVVGIFSLLKQWYSIRVAFFGAALFLCSSWLLHTTRLASPTSVYAAAPILLALWAWVLSGTRRQIALMLFTIAAMMALYVPGMLWILIPAIIWQRKNLVRAFKHIPIASAVLIGAVAVLLLLPFIFTVALPLQGTTWNAIRTFLALPAAMPTITDVATNLINVPKELFITSRGDPTMHLGRLPLLDAFATAMFVVGVYAFARDWRLDRTVFVFSALCVGCILIALGGLSTAILLPFVYLIIIGGASYLLQEWLRVFPRNPFARWLGVSLVVVTVLAAMTYQITNYFVAWPHAPETKSTFSQKL
jgi:hypothetical protein